MLALVEFLQAHAGDAVLDTAAMVQLNEAVVPAALATWPHLRQVLETEVKQLNTEAVFKWTADAGFAVPLTREQVFALTQLLMLQVGLPACLCLRSLVS